MSQSNQNNNNTQDEEENKTQQLNNTVSSENNENDIVDNELTPQVESFNLNSGRSEVKKSKKEFSRKNNNTDSMKKDMEIVEKIYNQYVDNNLMGTSIDKSKVLNIYKRILVFHFQPSKSEMMSILTSKEFMHFSLDQMSYIQMAFTRYYSDWMPRSMFETTEEEAKKLKDMSEENKNYIKNLNVDKYLEEAEKIEEQLLNINADVVNMTGREILDILSIWYYIGGDTDFIEKIGDISEDEEVKKDIKDVSKAIYKKLRQIEDFKMQNINASAN